MALMSTRILIGLTCGLFLAGAVYQGNAAASYVALGVWAILYLLHTVEFKLNKLLDPHEIHVMDSDIARD